MLGILPTELILYVLSFLPLRQLRRLRQTSKMWSNFFHVNESEIHHAAAILHNFVEPNANLETAQEKYVWLQGVRSWKDLCHKYCHLERSWEGREPPHDKAVVGHAIETAIWRFKVDEEQSTIITTFFHGGLKVADINDNSTLWSLPHTEVHPYAHCEYTDGYLIFTRRGLGIDVWRRKRDVQDIERPSTLQCDLLQERAQMRAIQSSLSVEQNDRGAFVPWTTIYPPHSTYALRATNSKLLLASQEAQEAYLYDVFSGRQIQTIPFSQNTTTTPIDVSYIELSSRHMFLCSERDVVVVPLDASDSQTCLQFPSQIPGFYRFKKQNAFRVSYEVDIGPPRYNSAADLDGTLIECMCEQEPLSPSGTIPIVRFFKAVHVSPCGSHFVTVDKLGCICIVRDFERALRDGTSLLDCMTVIEMRYPVANLAFEADKRIVVYVEHYGVFLIPLASQDHISIDTLDMKPSKSMRVLHVKRIYNDGMLNWSIHYHVRFCSCLQMTSSEIWYSWTKMHLQHELGLEANILRRIDFSKGPHEI